MTAGLQAAPKVAVVGAGLAGTLTAVHLLRSAVPVRVLLVERSGSFGPGIAYGTRDERHLLNVPAERMSAFDDVPGDFVAFAERHAGPVARGSYLTRALYGRYLRSVLAQAERGAARGCALERVADEAVRAHMTPDGVHLTLASGRREHCDHVVLALGSPRCPWPDPLPQDPRVVVNPWAPGALDGPPAQTLVVGAGLTAVDVALSACGSSATARVVAVSRKGRLPFAHLPGLREPAPPPHFGPGRLELAGLVDTVARHAAAMRERAYDWRDVVDGLRPLVPELWARLALGERRRFLDSHSRGWELRRHRMAPEVAWRIAALCSRDRFTTQRGAIASAHAEHGAIAVELEGGRTLRAQRIVVCTGLMLDVTRTTDPLLRSLLAAGVATPDPLGLGIRTAAGGALLDERGVPNRRLSTLGALRRGDLWETTAAGEIRTQARALAGRLAPPRHVHAAPDALLVER